MKFSDSHEWIEIQGNIGAIGVSSYAQKQLGDIVYVELPKIGRELRKGEESAVLESTKAAADVYTPMSGKIVEVNQKLMTNPELINTSPEGEGWIFKIEIKSTHEMEDLMERQDY